MEATVHLRNVVLQLHDDFLSDQRFEERVEQLQTQKGVYETANYGTKLESLTILEDCGCGTCDSGTGLTVERTSKGGSIPT